MAVQELLNLGLVAAVGFEAMVPPGQDGDKAGPHLQEIAQGGQRVLQKGVQVGRGEQPPVEGLDPGDLFPVLAIDERSMKVWPC